jgi:hypothetical protein
VAEFKLSLWLRWWECSFILECSWPSVGALRSFFGGTIYTRSGYFSYLFGLVGGVLFILEFSWCEVVDVKIGCHLRARHM